MKKVFFLFILLTCSALNFAQDFCSTPMELNDLTRGLPNRSTRSSSNSTYSIKVYFHIIRNTNGSGANAVQNNVQTAFNILNTDFNPHGIFFVWDNNIDYIDNDSYYSNPGTNIFSVNNHSDGVDIYLYGENVCEGGHANGIANSTELYLGGYISLYPSLYLSGTHVISHEMGHVLGLFHTHHGTFYSESDNTTCAEFVNGSNSDTCGDYIEDTPADPGLQHNVIPSNGQWLGYGITDANGDHYQPDTYQIMSYTHPSCMSHFSTMQGQRMKSAISSCPALQNCVLSICGSPYLYTSSTYYVQSLPAGWTVSWSFSSSYSYPSGLVQSNTPSANQCTLYNPDMAHVDGTLTATIYRSGGELYGSVSKNVKTSYAFGGTYWQEDHFNVIPNNISETSFYDGDRLIVGPKCDVYIKSYCFPGATITHTGANLNYWDYSLDGSYGVIHLRFPYKPYNQYLTIKVVGNSSISELYLDALSQPLLDFSPSLSVSSEGPRLNVILNIDAEDIKTTKDVMRSEDIRWDVVVSNALTGKVMYQKNVEGWSQEIDTSGWVAGVYAIKAQVGEHFVTQKTIVK